MTYYALIGDVDASREVSDRAELQRRIRQSIRSLNAGAVAEYLTVPLRLVAGDEVQGLATRPQYLLEVIVALSDAIAPARFSWGLGCGRLSTDLSTDIAVLDGSSFHRARDGLEYAKKRGRWFEMRGVEEPGRSLVNAVMNLMGAIRSGWTARQSDYVRAARGRTRTEAAEMEGVNVSTVSRALQATYFSELEEAELAARSFLPAVAPLEDA